MSVGPISRFRPSLTPGDFWAALCTPAAGRDLVAEFERRFARMLGVPEAVAVPSARAALGLVLRHATLPPTAVGGLSGGEVILPAFTYWSMPAAVIRAGMRPVFVDVGPRTYLIDPEKVESAITPRTRAIVPTHLYGCPCELDRILEMARRHGLLVIEDCAESLLADYKGVYTGAWGDVGCFSFQASKQLSLGDGGMATANSEELRKQIAAQAGAPTFLSVAYNLDFNYRMNEPTAAIGLAQLETMPAFIAKLRANARYYDEAVDGCSFIRLQRGPEGAHHSFYHWAATFTGDDLSFAEFKKLVESAGLSSVSIGYTNKPAYKHPLIVNCAAHAFHCPENKGHSGRYDDGACPVAERVIPRLILGYVVEPEETAKREAEKLHQVIGQLQGG